jgi:DNA-cytosine methyltransferase
MIALSLFDGISCGKVALERAGIPVSRYMASEVDKYAIKVSAHNHPDIVQLGCVKKVRALAEMGQLGHVDLLIGGSPCQGFSFAGKQLAFDDPRSALFFDYVAILKALRIDNPNIKFLLENVKMKKEHLAVISDQLGVRPVCINSALVSAQNRVRYYWCNWNVSQPDDKGILLGDIIEEGAVDREKSYCIDANYHKGGNPKSYFEKGRRQLVGIAETEMGLRPYKNDGRKGSFSEIGTIGASNTKAACLSVAHVPKYKEKSQCLRVGGIGSPPESRQSWDNALDSKIHYRKLTTIECERLQTLPDNYTAAVSNTQRYKCLGNGWTVDVIAHIFKEMQITA